MKRSNKYKQKEVLFAPTTRGVVQITASGTDLKIKPANAAVDTSCYRPVVSKGAPKTADVIHI